MKVDRAFPYYHNCNEDAEKKQLREAHLAWGETSLTDLKYKLNFIKNWFVKKYPMEKMY